MPKSVGERIQFWTVPGISSVNHRPSYTSWSFNFPLASLGSGQLALQSLSQQIGTNEIGMSGRCWKPQPKERQYSSAFAVGRHGIRNQHMNDQLACDFRLSPKIIKHILISRLSSPKWLNVNESYESSKPPIKRNATVVIYVVFHVECLKAEAPQRMNWMMLEPRFQILFGLACISIPAFVKAGMS